MKIKKKTSKIKKKTIIIRKNMKATKKTRHYLESVQFESPDEDEQRPDGDQGPAHSVHDDEGQRHPLPHLLRRRLVHGGALEPGRGREYKEGVSVKRM